MNRQRKEGESYEKYKRSLQLEEGVLQSRLKGKHLYSPIANYRKQYVHGEEKTIAQPAKNIRRGLKPKQVPIYIPLIEVRS